MYSQLFYTSKPLSDGEHTLLVTNIGDGTLWIDRVFYVSSVSSSTSSSLSRSTTPSLSPSTTPSLSPSTTLSLSPSTTSSLPPILTSRTITPTSSDTGLPGQVNSNNKPSILIPAVVGGMIGALILIIALIFGVLYYRKRAKRLAGARLSGKKNILDGKTMTQVSPHVSTSNLIRVRQIPRGLTRSIPVLPSRPLRGHILPAPMPHLIMGAPI
jgi:hypothetical protein